MQEQTIAIIGGGVVGLSSALALIAPERQVLLFERDALPARQSSWAGGGIVCPLWPWREPPTLWSLVSRSRALYPRLALRLQAEVGIDIEYRLSGIEWTLDEAERSRAEHWLRDQGLPFEDREGRLCCPVLGQVRNSRLGPALARAVEHRGGQLHCGAAAALWFDADRLRGVTVAGRQIEAHAVVMAAGAWSAAGGTQGSAPDIFPVKGQMLLTRVAGAAARPVRIGPDAYVIPRADDHVLIGSTVEHVGYDTRPTPDARERLMSAALRLAPWLAGALVLGHWAGLRPGMHQALPLVGPDATRGLWWNTGHYRNGITLAPACAEQLCQQMGYQSSLSPA